MQHKIQLNFVFFGDFVAKKHTFMRRFRGENASCGGAHEGELVPLSEEWRIATLSKMSRASGTAH